MDAGDARRVMRKLAVDRDGEIAVVNSTFRPDGDSRVQLIRGQLRGSR